MIEELCSVLVSHRSTEKAHGDAFGISGILLSDQWILTHGALLSSDLFEESEIFRFLMDARDDLEKDLLVLPAKLAKCMSFKLNYTRRNWGPQGRIALEKDCTLRIIWRCELLRKTFNDLLFSWSFEKVKKFDKSLLSMFLLLKIDDGDGRLSEYDARDAKNALWSFYSGHLKPRSMNELSLQRGTPVEIEYAPFGNPSFLDSVSRGVVSNVLGERGCLILNDANAVPGSEGAPLFILDAESRRVRGLVIAPLCWCRGEWVDYTFAANLRPCLSNILKVKEERFGNSIWIKPDELDKSLVVVKCGFGWGTGVIIDVPTGTVITCSHVVREAIQDSCVTIALLENDGDEAQVWARLVYKTREGKPYDIAVLKFERPHKNLKALPLANFIPDKGKQVTTAGFPFFGGSTASLSRGVVSRSSECMLQTTCCVQSGASGGPVLDLATGEMLGLVVSNAVSSAGESRALYPRFNMAVPAAVIKRPLVRYIRTGDVKYLQDLASNDPAIIKAWNFYLTPRSKI